MIIRSLEFRQGALLSLLALAMPLAMAQDYRIDWYVIAGGGGESSSADPQIPEIQLRGTIGQAALGTASGGSYELDAGYWVIFPATIQPPSPALIFSNGFEDSTP